MVNHNTVTRSDFNKFPVLKYDQVSVYAPARLHLGFLDLNGGLGRRFGSLGITLDDIRTRLHVRPSDKISGQGPSSARAVRHVERLVRALDLGDGLKVTVEEAIPEHVGLGSGTQLALAVGAAVSTLYELDLGPRQLAPILDRGRRSGIGIGSFEGGGVVLDGGQGPDNVTPPVLCRFDFPAGWRILMIFDHRYQGVHGTEEHEVFRHLPPFPAELSAHFCRLVLMGALPALAEGDIEGFGDAVAEIQRATGDFFAPVQGHRFASEAVAEVLLWLEREGIAGVGQSSWGPTGFALIGSEAEADRLIGVAQKQWASTEHLEFMICKGRNFGCEIETEEAAGGLARGRGSTASSTA